MERSVWAAGLFCRNNNDNWFFGSAAGSGSVCWFCCRPAGYWRWHGAGAFFEFHVSPYRYSGGFGGLYVYRFGHVQYRIYFLLLVVAASKAVRDTRGIGGAVCTV